MNRHQKTKQIKLIHKSFCCTSGDGRSDASLGQTLHPRRQQHHTVPAPTGPLFE